MKKCLFVFLFFPLFIYAQFQDSLFYPNKLNYIKYLNAVEKKIILDTNNLGFSFLEYHSFSTNGQFIKAKHYQSVNKYLDIGIDISKFSQDGVFKREGLSLHDVNTLFSFTNKNKTYSMHSIFSYQKIRMDENGGLIDYSFNKFDDALLFDVSLLTAENRSKNRFHNINHCFMFSDNISLVNNLSLLKKSKNYNDDIPTSGFYQTIYSDSTITRDSLSNINIDNTIGLKIKNLQFNHEFKRRQYFSNEFDSTDYDNGLSINFNNSTHNLKSELKYFISNQYYFSLSKEFDKKSWHKLEFVHQRNRLPIFYNTLISNNYIFKNNFDDIISSYLRYNYKSRNFYFESILNRYSNHIFLNEIIEFEQLKTPVLYLKSTLNHNWSIKNLGGNNWVNYHYTTNDVVRFPTLNASSSIWYGKEVNDKNLRFKIGAKINYYTSYFANVYNPALAHFQLQNQTEIGGLPYIISFLDIQISNMNLKLEYKNLNHFFSIPHHFYMPNYPSLPTTIHLSLNWKLNNRNH
ncbi:MAG: putative porin [Flavobacteriales bacterium]